MIELDAVCNILAVGIISGHTASVLKEPAALQFNYRGGSVGQMVVKSSQRTRAGRHHIGLTARECPEELQSTTRQEHSRSSASLGVGL